MLQSFHGTHLPTIHENSDEIYKAGLCLYYNEPTRQNKSKIATLMINTIATHPVNSLIERGVISSFAFFIDKGFIIDVDVNDFVPNLQPTVPNNWQNSITTRVLDNIQRSDAIYFVRKGNQTFYLSIIWDSLSNDVIVNLNHTRQNHKPLNVHLVESELNGLSDPEHGTIFAMNIEAKFVEVMAVAIEKATQDLGPIQKCNTLDVSSFCCWTRH